MPISYWSHIKREYAQKYKDYIWVFGDNEERKGFGGLAKQLRGETNSIGIRTKRSPSLKPEAFWTDLADYDRACKMIDVDLLKMEQALSEGKKVILPKAGIGTGLSRLSQWAPEIKKHLDDGIMNLIRKYGVEL